MMFLRRSGIEVSPLAKRLLHASFVLSFLLAFLALHSDVSRRACTRPREAQLYTDPVLLQIGIPGPIAGGLIFACGAAYLISVVGAVVNLASACDRLASSFPWAH